jgi:hypothetical protein
VVRPILPRSIDTEADAEEVQLRLLRAAPPGRRLQIAFRLSATVIGAARRAIARARPQATKRELDLRFVEVHYGADLARALRAHLERRDTAAAASDHDRL